MAKRFIILFLCFLSLETHGTYSFSLQNRGEISLAPASYRRYVRPQLRSIVREFYSLLVKMEPYQTEILRAKKTAFQLNKDWHEWVDRCLQINEECQAKLQEIYKMSRMIDSIALKVDFNRVNIEKAQAKDTVDATIKLLFILSEISNLNYKLLHYLEEVTMTHSTTYYPYIESRDQFSPMLHKILTYTEILVTSQITPEVQPYFDFVWNSYIKRIENYILFPNNQSYLLNHLEDLNIAWNSFHLKVSKELPKKTLGKNNLKTINTMHRRWNSVLKVILRN